MGGSSSTTVQENKIPAYLEEAGRLAVDDARKIKEMGYLPYFGPEIAALNPYEQARAQNVGNMASAFGLSAPAAMDMSGVDTATSGGVTGYTTAPAYFSALERLKETRPDQYEYFANLGRFDPITGAPTSASSAAQSMTNEERLAARRSKPRADVAAFLSSQAPYAGEGSRMSTGRGSGSTGSAPLRPLLRPDSRVGLSGMEQNIREGISTYKNNSPIGKLFSALTNRA